MNCYTTIRTGRLTCAFAAILLLAACGGSASSQFADDLVKQSENGELLLNGYTLENCKGVGKEQEFATLPEVDPDRWIQYRYVYERPCVTNGGSTERTIYITLENEDGYWEATHASTEGSWS